MTNSVYTETPSMESIEILLIELGAQPHLDGFVYLARAVQLYCTGNYHLLNQMVTAIAHDMNRSEKAVIRALYYVIHNSFDLLKRLSQRTGIPIKRQKITTASVVAHIAMLVKYTPEVYSNPELFHKFFNEQADSDPTESDGDLSEEELIP